MIRNFKRLSITSQAIFFLVLLLASTISALYFWATDNALESELSHTRTVADMADAYRAQAAKHGGFYVRRETSTESESVGRYLAAYEAEIKASDGSRKSFTFYQKNPFLALGDYSAEVQRSPAAAKFRMVSDNFMNPANTPDMFELRALDALRSDNQTEYWAVVNGQLRFARALKATKACLGCHGSPDSAPSVVTTQYRPPVGSSIGGGYGYKEGDVVGLTSVSVPHKTPRQMLAAQTAGFWVSAFGVLALMFASYGVITRGVVRPLREQSRYADLIANSEDLRNIQAPVFDSEEGTSRNEMHLQSHALKSLHESMQAASDYINKVRK